MKKHIKSIASNYAGIANKWYFMPAVFFASFVWLEILLKLFIGEKNWAVGLIYTLIFTLCYSFFIYFVALLFKGKWRKLVSDIMFFAVWVLYISQTIYYMVFQTFYCLYSAAKGGQVAQFYKDILYAIWLNFPWFIAALLPLFFYFIIPPKFRENRGITSPKIFIFPASALVAFAVAIIPINVGSKDVNSAYDLYYRSSFPIYSVNNLGLLTTMRIDLQRSVLGLNLSDELIDELSNESSVSSGSTNGNTPTIAPTITAAPTEKPVFEPNIMKIDFDKLAEKASDKTMKKIHNYFAGVSPTLKNNYTGKMKDYNLILITAESFSHYAVREDLTPTLYKMVNEGFNFKNFYNPVWGVSTSDGEYVATTGLIPKSGVWSMLKSAENSMPFAMGNQFRKLGVETRAYHNHTYTYYGRDKSHPNLGYIYKGLGNGLKVKKQWPESDLEMMQVTIPEYINQERFHAYYMTVSGHLSYNFMGNMMAVKNKALVKDLPYSERVQAYLSTQIELDRAMQYLLEELEKAGKAEKTLIVISADHYPYGLKNEEIDELAGHFVERNFELYKSSLVMYCKGMKPEVIERPVSSLDIIPTVSNLLGLEYDSRLLMGIDIFSDTPPLVIFSNRSYITDGVWYNSLTKAYESKNGTEITEDFKKNMKNFIDRKFYYSAKILETDYYRKVMAAVSK